MSVRGRPAAAHGRGRVVVLLGLVLLSAGCGEGRFWARWRAERGAWRARRAVERIEISPRLAGAAYWARADATCRSVTTSFPAGAWSARARAGDAMAFDVLEASGRAALLRARLEALHERREEALAGYERVRRDYAAVPAISLEAAVARAGLLAESGRGGEAESVWSAIARDYPVADPRTGTVFDAVLDAPLVVARDRRARGDVTGADSVLRAAEETYRGVLPTQRGSPVAPALWARVSEARSERGDAVGARAALRQALAYPAAAVMAPRLVLMLARQALGSAQPDTALAYAAWAARDFGGAVRPEALLVTAQAWRARGTPDSALQTYERLLEEESGDPDKAAEARFGRARLLEDLGRWDQARGEYHALASAVPTHPLAFESMVRVVRYHLARGERGLGLTEARYALAALDALIGSQQDDGVQVRAGEARARVLFETDDIRGGCGALAALLRRYPEAPLDAVLLMRAAEAAETRLNDTDLALELYRAATVRAVAPELRRRALAATGRLAGPPR
jgi:tetratricopeptide (TPR) repeat protein